MNKVHYHHEKQRYSIRKYAFGAASVLIGCAYMANVQVAHADQATAAQLQKVQQLQQMLHQLNLLLK